MTDRDRLIDLIHDSDLSLDSVRLADHLLSNGVIVPPCKVGDMFYIVKSYTNSYLEIVSREVVSTLVKEILINENGIVLVTEESEYNAEDIGGFIFLTKEEAEAELRKRSKDNA